VIAPDQQRPGAAAAAAPSSAHARNFIWRAASAAVLGPVAIACTYVGGWLFLGLCALAAAAILWEWTSLMTRRTDLRMIVPGIAALLGAVVLVGEARGGTAIVTVAAGAMLAAGAVAAWPRASAAAHQTAWAAGGVIYAGVALLGPALLRDDPEDGLTALLFLFATVWATDIFAYLVGRAVGPPLLWPRLSPNKTWSGALGGLAGGVAAGTAVAYASGGTKPLIAAVLALVLSICSQAGDLFESAVKRRFGVKDSSSLIPGHGGVMDRLDGFLVAALAAVVIGIVRQGMAAPARGLLVW
jgi:phosphatidate cytidylyltransferase